MINSTQTLELTKYFILFCFSILLLTKGLGTQWCTFFVQIFSGTGSKDTTKSNKIYFRLRYNNVAMLPFLTYSCDDLCFALSPFCAQRMIFWWYVKPLLSLSSQSHIPQSLHFPDLGCHRRSEKIASKQENMTKIPCYLFLLATLSTNKILKS